MVAALAFLVGQLFLFGATSAQCPVDCSPCKEFPDGDYKGTWNIKAEIDPLCPDSCLYQKNSDEKEMCFCDPGPIEYDNCTGCPVGVEYNDMCYISVDTPKTWLDAKEDCKSRGGDLASIKNADVNSFVANLVGPRTWIGATDAETEGVWKWTNGDIVKWTNWGPENPDNYLGNQHCATINYQTTGHWDDDGCTVEHPYICQINKDPTTTTKQARATATSITTTIATTSDATTSSGDDGSCDKNNYTLVLTGGDNPQRLNSSEQISFTGVCSSPNIPQLPEAITGGKSVWFEPNTLMFCGGSNHTFVVGAVVSGATNKCLKLTPGNNAWENNDAFNMNVDRSYFSLNYINGYGAIAAGGYNNNNTVLDSLEKYSDGEWKKIENIKLDKPTYTHCAVQYTKRDGDFYLMIIGGSNSYNEYNITASATEINLSTGDKVSVVPGPLPGLWAPACTICGDDIYVSGGGKKNGDDVGIASSTDVYKYNIPAGGPFTLLTGKLKTPRWGHTMGVTSKGQLVVSGGYRQSGFLASIESSEDGGASWKTWAPALSTKQAAAAMASVPAFIFTCTD